MLDTQRLQILTESAKYDVSCSSSGSKRVNTEGGLGNANFGGICHSFTPDGRCISLLKILLSNECVYNCEYCPNRVEADVPRTSASPQEICELVVAFYKRNYIEGLFLSSAVHITPNHTMEQLYQTVLMLRNTYHFNGYIHLKGIPHADPEIMKKAAKLVDRMSYNIELPSEKSLKLLAPQKTKQSLLAPMLQLRDTMIYDKENKVAKNQRSIPAGQTTQLIIGASPESDGQILQLTQSLYDKMNMKRVYFSSYLPIVESSLLPTKPTGLLREHRLYQADWLIRFYGFTVDEICDEQDNLSLEYDPKCAWALRNMHIFPIEINTAPYELLLRVPGIGTKSVYKIINARKYTKLDFTILEKMRVVLKRAKYFITCNGKFYGSDNIKQVQHNLLLAEQVNENEQLNLFSTQEVSYSALTGEL